jgi:hypothetical protein
MFAEFVPFYCLGFLVAGTLMVVVGARPLVRTRRRRRTWHAYPGRIVASRTDGDQVRCQVAYDRDGTKVLFWNRYTTTLLRDPVGREVPVLVNPADPRDAVVAGGTVNGSVISVVFVVVGVLALGRGLFLALSLLLA